MDLAIFAHHSGDIDRHVRHIADELRKGFEAVARIDRPAVTIFGSARLPETDHWYRMALATGKAFAAEG